MTIERLEKMESILKVLSTSSCLQVYFYLKIYGKSPPSEIGNIVQISNATLFRHLNLLKQSDLVEREKNEMIEDKRFTSKYFVCRDLHSLYEYELDEKLEKIAKDNGIEYIIEDWTKLIPNIASVFADSITQLFMKIHSQSKLKIKHGHHEEILDEVKSGKIMSFGIIDEEKYDEFTKEIFQVLMKYRKRKKITIGEAITNPVAFSINVMKFPTPEEKLFLPSKL